MAIGRNQSRRNRVFLDESLKSSLADLESLADAAVSSNPSTPEKKAYSIAGQRDGQMKTTDLIPIGAKPLAIVVMLCIAMIALINFLAIKSGSWESWLSPAALHSISYSGVGSLSNWFSSLLLLITGMASLQIYGMRRHRCDDYSGNYRIWLWMAALFVLASFNFVVDIRAVFGSLTNAAGYSGSRGITIVLIAKFVALSALVVRGIFEIRASRMAMIAVVLVWVAYSSAMATQIPVIHDTLVSNNEIVYGNSVLIGTFMTFISVMIYARFVYLHANGMIQMSPANQNEQPNRKTVSRKKSEVLDQPAVSRTLTGQSAEEILSSKSKKVKNSNSAELDRLGGNSEFPKSDAESAATEEILSLSSATELSKSERRRLKKLQNRENRAA